MQTFARGQRSALRSRLTRPCAHGAPHAASASGDQRGERLAGVGSDIARARAAGRARRCDRTGQQLGQIAGGEQDAGAGGGEATDGGVDLGLGADVDAGRRLVEQQQARRWRSARASSSFCWLPPDSESIGASVPAARIARRVDPRLRVGAVPRRATEPAASAPAERGSRARRGSAPAPCGRGPRAPAAGAARSVDACRPAAAQAGDRLEHRAAPGADQAGEADDLASAHRERRRRAPRPTPDRATRSTARRAARDRPRRRGTSRPTMRSHQIGIDRQLAGDRSVDPAAVAQHGDAVGERQHLVEAVADVDARRRRRRGARAHGSEQALALSPAPSTAVGSSSSSSIGRARAARGPAAPACAGWRRQRAEARRRRARRSRRAGQRRRRRGAHRRARRSQPSAAAQLGGRERSTPPHVQIRRQLRLLRHPGDARAGGVADLSAPAARHDAGEHPQQRRLAGAVLADHGVHLAAAQIEVDAVERDVAP